MSAKTNRWQQVAAHAVAPEAEEAEVSVTPLLSRRPALRLRARHLLEDAGQAVLLLRAARAEAVVCAAAQRCRDCRS